MCFSCQHASRKLQPKNRSFCPLRPRRRLQRYPRRPHYKSKLRMKLAQRDVKVTRNAAPWHWEPRPAVVLRLGWLGQHQPHARRGCTHWQKNWQPCSVSGLPKAAWSPTAGTSQTPAPCANHKSVYCARQVPRNKGCANLRRDRLPTAKKKPPTQAGGRLQVRRSVSIICPTAAQ